MQPIETKLLTLLKTIEGNGSFATSGVKNFTLPGLHIEGVGKIGFPLNAVQAKEIINVSKKAPFGKGSQTITDTTVRSAWEIDADQLSFHHDAWAGFIKEIIADIKVGLGIEEGEVTASLYKLLLYETDDFFLPHKDSEKEPGMFGTLVIGLPGSHTGGALHIRFDGREEIVDFSPATSLYKMPFVAFFADCDHEIKPVTSGYRICLVYNLVYASGSKKVESPQFMSPTKDMAALLAKLAVSIEHQPNVVLLDNQYTPANFSGANLKHHDKPRAEAMLAAADKAGYFGRLGLVTHYQMGEMEGGGYNDYCYNSRNRRGRYEEPEEESGTMGEVYDTHTSIKHWADDKGPGLGTIFLDEEDLITDIEIGTDDPLEKQEEGYTGNAGMTIQYWYHYGAVILWPKSKHLALLSAAAVPVKLEWLYYYLQNWENEELHSQDYAKQLLLDFQGIKLDENWKESWDFTAAAAVLSKLKDEKFLLNNCADLLVTVFDKITIKAWADLLQQYRPGIFTPIFEKAADIDDVSVVNHLLNILKYIEELNDVALDGFLSDQIHNIPLHIIKVQLSDLGKSYGNDDDETRKAVIMSILEKVLSFSKHYEHDETWIKNTLEVITKSLPRKYVNRILAGILLSRESQNRVLANALHSICVREVSARAAAMPTPPPNWTRDVPTSSKYNREIWEILRPFLDSPTERVFEYRKNESYRQQMESAIRNVTIDLRMETIQKGSPYTLKLTKTQAAYERSFKKWQEDVELLEELNKWERGGEE